MKLFLGPGQFLIVPYQGSRKRTRQLRVPYGHWYEMDPKPKVLKKATDFEWKAATALKFLKEIMAEIQ